MIEKDSVLNYQQNYLEHYELKAQIMIVTGNTYDSYLENFGLLSSPSTSINSTYNNLSNKDWTFGKTDKQ